MKLIESKKYKEATRDYLTYGQPVFKSDITYPCEHYIKEYANDPSSVDIIDKIIEGQSKKGWFIIVKYRAKNGFGALVLQATEFEVRFDAVNKIYQVGRIIS